MFNKISLEHDKIHYLYVFLLIMILVFVNEIEILYNK